MSDGNPGRDGDAAALPLSEAEWQARLTPQEYDVLRNKGTERAFTGAYNDTKAHGTYVCAGCGQQLFNSDTKFDSGTGWPSFFKTIRDDCVVEHQDDSNGMVRTEVVCSRCEGHLGHLFEDGPQPTHLRYCLNSISLHLNENGDA